MATDKELCDALNLICQTCCEGLPDGAMICIEMYGGPDGDASMELYIDGDDVSSGWDGESHTIRALIEAAHELSGDKQ